MQRSTDLACYAVYPCRFASFPARPLRHSGCAQFQLTKKRRGCGDDWDNRNWDGGRSDAVSSGFSFGATLRAPPLYKRAYQRTGWFCNHFASQLIGLLGLRRLTKGPAMTGAFEQRCASVFSDSVLGLLLALRGVLKAL